MVHGKSLRVESLERREVFSATGWEPAVATGDLPADVRPATEWCLHKPGAGATGQSRLTIDASATDLAFQSQLPDSRHQGIIAVLIGL